MDRPLPRTFSTSLDFDGLLESHFESPNDVHRTLARRLEMKAQALGFTIRGPLFLFREPGESARQFTLRAEAFGVPLE